MTKNIKIIPFIIIALISLSCQDCKEWYTSIELKGATQAETTNEQLEGWFETEYLTGELNFWVAYYYTADGFERCKSSTKIHSIEKEKMVLVCSNPMFIGDDTIAANTNIIKYFDLALELKGNDFYVFDTINYEFPKFPSLINEFRMTVPLSDGDILTSAISPLWIN